MGSLARLGVCRMGRCLEGGVRMDRWWLIGVVMVAAVASGCANLKQENADLRLQVEACRAERDSLQDQVTVLDGQNQALSDRLSQAQASSSEELEELRKRLGGEVQLTVRGGFITMELPDKVLYRSGEAKLTESGKATLRKVAAALKSEFADQPVRVEGHTDSDPIRRTRELYQSNWELSSARALEVVHYLAEQCAVDPKRVYAAAFGEHRPVAPNTTAASKAQNRRVAVVILPAGPK